MTNDVFEIEIEGESILRKINVPKKKSNELMYSNEHPV